MSEKSRAKHQAGEIADGWAADAEGLTFRVASFSPLAAPSAQPQSRTPSLPEGAAAFPGPICESERRAAESLLPRRSSAEALATPGKAPERPGGLPPRRWDRPERRRPTRSGHSPAPTLIRQKGKRREMRSHAREQDNSSLNGRQTT
ncbi:uncharacterized protein LOC128588442 [Nycticebus coucang]|uniref:uncharacterized protein LOC128588442 n=1 Tax=Nycticebus coucang TaxID=9470 RepID=UPI00234DD233|nr:uncharacterized protein LOC128588442 [Nycticebus coucang]